LISNHALYQQARSDLGRWMPSDEMQLASLRRRLEDRSISPLQRYELGSFLWCKSLVQVLTRLKKIRAMMTRSIYKKKGEEKGKLLKDWMSYNYQLYSVVYQSVLEVALLLTNEVLDLGYSDRQCGYGTICDNRRVKAANILPPLRELHRTTLVHRQGKNLLVHQGKSIPLPKSAKLTASVDFSALAQELGTGESELKAILDEFLTLSSRKKLLVQMEKECREVEARVVQLLDRLSPQYTRVHSYYEQ